MPTLEELKRQCEELTIQITAEKSYKAIKQLQDERGKILAQIIPLEAESEEKREHQCGETLDALLSQNRHLILLDILYSTRTERINIPPDLKIKIVYEPCGHKETMPLKNLLREYDFQGGLRVPKPNSLLLFRWKELSTSEPVFGRRSCSQCQKHKKKPIGWAHFSLRWIH